MPDKQERNCPCGDETCHLDREKKMVVIEPAKDGKKAVWCDPCIEPIVRALNDAGLKTIASCCGHGFRPGNIILADKREIVIARNFEEGRAIDRLFPIDINGDSCQAQVSIDADAWRILVRETLLTGQKIRRFLYTEELPFHSGTNIESLADPEPLYPASALASKDARIAELERHVEALTDKLGGKTCGCAYDHPDDICLHHSPKLTAAQSEAAALREQVKGMRSLIGQASEIIARLERDYAIEHQMYDGRPVEEWCKRARKALEGHTDG